MCWNVGAFISVHLYEWSFCTFEKKTKRKLFTDLRGIRSTCGAEEWWTGSNYPRESKHNIKSFSKNQGATVPWGYARWRIRQRNKQRCKTSLWWIVGNRQWTIVRGMLEASRRKPMACRQTGLLYLSECARIVFGVDEAVHCTDLCGFDSHRLTKLLTKLIELWQLKNVWQKPAFCAFWRLHLVRSYRGNIAVLNWWV